MEFSLYFLGAEQKGWRDLLWHEGVEHMGLSFAQLSRRMPKKKPWLVADNFPEGVNVLLDSGGYSANKQPAKHTQGEWKSYADEYSLFVEGNIDALTIVTEFDCLALGPDWIHQQREQFYDHLPREKFCPVWHHEWGMTELERLAETYERIAIPEEALRTGRNIAPRLNAMVHSTGVKLHGLAMTKTDEMRGVLFESVSSTSWLSPMQYGDTIVWDGSRLRRYPVRYKEQARKRHRMLFERAGFNAEAIVNDSDANEVARFTVWSWLQLEDSVQRRRTGGSPFAALSGADDIEEPFEDLGDEGDSNSPDTEATGRNAEKRGRGVADPHNRVRNAAQLKERSDDEIQVLPTLGLKPVYDKVTEVDEETGKTKEVEVLRTHLPLVSTMSLRQCDSCYVAEKCPAYKPEHKCVYNIPVNIKTKEERMAFFDGMIEMQAQRVLEMRLTEQLEGGYADPNLSNEIDRLKSLIAQKEEFEDNRDTLRVSLEARAQSGAISRLFGGIANTEPLHELPPGDQMSEAETNRVLEAKVLDG